jgi:hypothetical protein
MVQHPVSSLDIDGLRERAKEALPQVLEALGVADPSAEPRAGATADVS